MEESAVNIGVSMPDPNRVATDDAFQGLKVIEHPVHYAWLCEDREDRFDVTVSERSPGNGRDPRRDVCHHEMKVA